MYDGLALSVAQKTYQQRKSAQSTVLVWSTVFVPGMAKVMFFKTAIFVHNAHCANSLYMHLLHIGCVIGLHPQCFVAITRHTRLEDN